MKLHLPYKLYHAVLACFAVAVSVSLPAIADVPEGYTSVTIGNVTQLEQYKAKDRIAFFIESDINDTLYSISGVNQYWTSNDQYTPVYLTYSGFSACAISCTELSMRIFGCLEFDNNTGHYLSSYSYAGGAIYAGGGGGDISLTENAEVRFSRNHTGSKSYTSTTSDVSAHGGAIYASKVNISYNGDIVLNLNYVLKDHTNDIVCRVRAVGGAIDADDISFLSNKDISFLQNYASSNSTANTSTSVSNSSAYAYSYGGAICGSSVIMSGNADISFCSNSTVASGNKQADAYGGAIYVKTGGNLSLNNNRDIVFVDNSVTSPKISACGGAIYGAEKTLVSLTNNNIITFENNSAKKGGAIYLALESKLIIAGNENVTFVDNSGYDIYHEGSVMNLCAGKDKSIAFFDGVYASSSVAVSYNIDYEGTEGGQAGLGDILFCGKSSSINANARLYGGRLRIEDGAIYKGTGLITQTNSAARVVLNKGTVNLSGDLLISAGTTLELRNANALTASSLTLNSGSTLSFVLDAGHLSTAALTVTGDILKQKGELTLSISPDSVLEQDGSYRLMTSSTGSAFTGWDSTKMTISGLPLSTDSLRWEGGTLYLDYTVPMAWTGAFSDTWDAGTPNWSKNGGDVTYEDALSVEFGNGASGTVRLAGALAPKSVIVNNDAEHAYTFAGSGKLTGTMVLAKSGEGTLTIGTANDYTGGTFINGGTLVANHATALGTGKVQLSGGTLVMGDAHVANSLAAENTATLTIAEGVVWAPTAVITNSGTLTVSGDIDASALSLVTTGTDTHIDVQGKSGTSGFERLAERSVLLVNGGTTEGTDAHVSHRDLNEKLTLVLGADGVARAGGSTDYSNYLLTGSVVARSSAIHAVAGAENAAITMQSGTLTVDDAAEVAATGGSIYLSGGTVSGTLSGVTVTASRGTIDAAFSGNSKLTGSSYALENALQNSGTLTLSGSFDLSALSLQHVDATRTDVNGAHGASGFATGEGYAVQVVQGGTTVNNGAVLQYGTQQLTIDASGYASTALQTDYSNYLLTGTDEVATAAVHTMGSAATITQTGGTLTVNDTATVTSTGGTILLAGGTLNGSVSNATIAAATGTLNATLSGNTLLSGTNYALLKTISNAGALTMSGSFDVSALTLSTGAATHVDVNGISGASGFAKAGDKSVRVVNGGTVVNSNAVVKHGSLSLTLGADGIARAVGATDYRTYTLTGTDMVMSSAVHGFSAAATVTMNGGTLVADDAVNVTATGGAISLQGGSVSGSLQNVSVTATSGSIQATFAGTSALVGQDYALTGALLNSGTLTLRGSFAADNLALRHVAATRVDVNGVSGTSGFAKDEVYAVTLVNGGTAVNGGAVVTHGTHTLVLGTDGVATEGGAVNYGTYLLVNGASAATSAIHGFNPAATVSMSGGMLTVDDAAVVNAMGGSLSLNGGALSGSLNNVTLTAASGAVSASFAGTNTLIGNRFAPGSVLSNTGTLVMSGEFDVSALSLQTTDATHIDVNGNSGVSGFEKYGDSSVVVVNGGTVVNSNAVVKHGNLSLTLGSDGVARATGTTLYGTYVLTGADAVTSSAVHGVSSSATITQTGGTLTVNDAVTVNATAGQLNLNGGTLNGTVSGSVISATSGSIGAVLSGSNSLTGNAYALRGLITNTGTLEMQGSFNASALTLNTAAATHVDVNGKSGTSGFAKSAEYSVQLVSGGTVVNSGATVTHGTRTLELGADGVARSGGVVDYTDYLLTGTATASTSAIHGVSADAVITQTGGTLTVNDTATVNATAGKITLSGGTLNGTLRGTTITATSGTIAAALTGNNTLTGSNYALHEVIANNGVLTIGGTLDVSALTLNSTAATHVDVNGNSGASGFAKDAAYAVTLVDGGSTVNGGATIKHGTRTLTLGTDGVARSGGAVNYGTYLLTGNDAASTSAIHAKGASATVSMNGGTLTVNDTATVNATGGSILLNSGAMKGSLANVAVTAVSGALQAGMSGYTTLTGQHYALTSVLSNTGTLVMSGQFNASALTLNTTAATHVDVNGNSGASGFAKEAVYSVKLVDGGTVVNSGATVTHGTRTLELGSDGSATAGGAVDYATYLLTGTATASTGAIHAKAAGAAVSMSGGTLTVNDAATVNATGGTVVLSSGTLDGSLNDVTVNAAGGTLAADMRGGKLAVNGNVNLAGYAHTSIELNSGRLTAAETLELESGQSLSFKGGRLTGDVLTGTGSTLTLGSNATLNGDLTLDGGQLALNGNTLAVAGALNLVSTTSVDISSYAIGTYKLLTFGALEGRLDNLVLSGSRYRTSVSEENGALTLTVKALNNNLTWNQPKGTWSNLGSFGTGVFRADDDVNFRSAANVTISGTVTPGSVLVNTPGNVVLVADKKVYGSGISGEGSVTKSGAGMLTMNAGNTYSGGTVLNAGTLKATAIDSFGTGVITVKGGTLDLGSKAVANDIVLSGTATLKGDAKYVGDVSVDGNATLSAKVSYKGLTTIGSGSSLSLAEKATMAGSIAVDGGRFIITAPKGMTLAKGATMTLDNGGAVRGLLTVGAGSTLVWADGSFETAAPVLKGGTLDLGAENSLTLTGSKAQVAFGDKRVELPGKGVVYTDETLTVNGGTVTLNAVNGYESGIEVAGGTLKLSTGKVTTDNEITVSGNAAVVNGKMHFGDITVNGTLAKGTNITIAADKTASLNGTGVMLGTIAGAGTVDVNASIDATAAKISAAHINLNNGTFTNTKGIKLAKGQTLTLAGASLNLGPKGALATAAGSTLVVSSATSLTGNLTLGGGELVFAGGSLDVDGMLTLSKAMTVKGSGSITYTTLKPFKGDISVLFGGAEVVQEGNTLTITGEEAVGYRLAPAPLDMTPALPPAPVTNPVADAMVQADWGILDAERAFMGAVNSRHQHAALLDKGRGAAWVSAFGSSVRHGNKGAHHGSDGNIEGAAFGLEHAVSESGSIGLAVGRSKNRLSATGVTHLRQETAHVALYGQKHLAHGFTADAAASYGDTETKLGAASWQQKSAVLTARLTHAQQVPDATALAFRTFGGLAYEATDAGSIGSAHTGSVQNLRAELGAGATHTAGKAHLYAEAALTGDLLRHNPTTDLDGFCTHGANPGRIGLRATVGGLYEFTDTWSGTASYGIETESRSTSHTLNIGVSKSF